MHMEYFDSSLLLELSPLCQKLTSDRFTAKKLQNLFVLQFVARHYTLINYTFDCLYDLFGFDYIVIAWLLLILNFLNQSGYLNRTVVFNLRAVSAFDEDFPHPNSASVQLLKFFYDFSIIAFFVIETDNFMFLPTVFISKLLFGKQTVQTFMSFNIF